MRIKKRIFFPDGEWLGIESRFITMGPAVESILAGLEQIPFFIRRGSIIPVRDDTLSLAGKSGKKLGFEIFEPDNKIYHYYEDDGITEEYRQGRFSAWTRTRLVENVPGGSGHVWDTHLGEH